ncbi:hypothetical protein CEXT_760821 [Caerostris extrusa]|uniref:Uncharacterized protein n=1 Tax=Caerostris extrusa TaxID=172846 RepID=A0AAV4NAD7_CAEEX|nr:hypothetical protein CEXT_760821 [Caerostris extrusa]
MTALPDSKKVFGTPVLSMVAWRIVPAQSATIHQIRETNGICGRTVLFKADVGYKLPGTSYFDLETYGGTFQLENCHTINKILKLT